MIRVPRPLPAAAVVASALALSACRSVLKDELPDAPPALADMEEPLALREEPKDEGARAALPAGSFTGLTVAEAKRSLDQLAGGGNGSGVRVTRVVENSPADAAGIEEDDLLLDVATGAGTTELHWPSEWRKVELETPPGTPLTVTIDRAAEERSVRLTTVARVRPAERMNSERFREEKRIGVVLRTATETEARAAGLGPGGGAVIVGLSAASPWRTHGLAFGDVLVAVDGRPVAHPQQVLEAIQGAKRDARLSLEILRKGERRTADVPVSRRAQEVRRISIPFVYSYENDRGTTETSILLGAFRERSTPAAWECTILWLVSFSGGDADRLVEAKE